VAGITVRFAQIAELPRRCIVGGEGAKIRRLGDVHATDGSPQTAAELVRRSELAIRAMSCHRQTRKLRRALSAKRNIDQRGPCT